MEERRSAENLVVVETEASVAGTGLSRVEVHLQLEGDSVRDDGGRVVLSRHTVEGSPAVEVHRGHSPGGVDTALLVSVVASLRYLDGVWPAAPLTRVGDVAGRVPAHLEGVRVAAGGVTDPAVSLLPPDADFVVLVIEMLVTAAAGAKVEGP